MSDRNFFLTTKCKLYETRRLLPVADATKLAGKASCTVQQYLRCLAGSPEGAVLVTNNENKGVGKQQDNSEHTWRHRLRAMSTVPLHALVHRIAYGSFLGPTVAAIPLCEHQPTGIWEQEIENRQQPRLQCDWPWTTSRVRELCLCWHRREPTQLVAASAHQCEASRSLQVQQKKWKSNSKSTKNMQMGECHNSGHEM